MNFMDYVYLMLGLRKINSFKTLRTLKINKVEKNGKSNSKESKQKKESLIEKRAIVFISKIVTIATWFMVSASILSLFSIIAFAIIGKEAPPILSQLLLVMIGYLGGVIASYMRIMIPTGTDRENDDSY